ncbi:hypothetical protein NA8A_05588 [Nitratireductor indicus C115]|uniref:Uncharacterized protein n=1 Tax=Nitratireductor indicus C115 TaxID=1231190 RepID=K2NZV9_9HYPH|nr:hypothetical protein NA8A_05588 [Nitratireductor indicus C115]
MYTKNNTISSDCQIFEITIGRTNAVADDVVRHLVAAGVKFYRRKQDDRLTAPISGGRTVAATNAVILRAVEQRCEFIKNGRRVDAPAALVTAIRISPVWPDYREVRR